MYLFVFLFIPSSSRAPFPQAVGGVGTAEQGPRASMPIGVGVGLCSITCLGTCRSSQKASINSTRLERGLDCAALGRSGRVMKLGEGERQQYSDVKRDKWAERRQGGTLITTHNSPSPKQD